MEIKYVNVFVGPLIEADVICAYLNGHGIEARLFDSVLSTYGDAFGNGIPLSARVAVREELGPKAKELIDSRQSIE